jgi:hypothetical protein
MYTYGVIVSFLVPVAYSHLNKDAFHLKRQSHEIFDLNFFS